MSETKPVKIFVGLPVDDGARPQFWHSVLEMSFRIGDLLGESVQFSINQELGDSLITRARNNVAHSFLKSDCDYLLFLDTDIEFAPEHIASIVTKRREDAVVCGGYPIKQPELRMCYVALPGEQKDADGLLRVAEAGTGCMLIPRRILEAYREKMPELEYTCEGHKDRRHSFFDVGVVGKGDRASYKSEDWLFCIRVRQLGFSVLVDTTFCLKHWGWIGYPLSDNDLITAIASRVPLGDEACLKSYLDDIDKATRARWIKRQPDNSTMESKPCNAS